MDRNAATSVCQGRAYRIHRLDGSICRLLTPGAVRRRVQGESRLRFLFQDQGYNTPRVHGSHTTESMHVIAVETGFGNPSVWFFIGILCTQYYT